MSLTQQIIIPEATEPGGELRQYLQASVSISTPANEAQLGNSFIIAGTASCEALRDIPGETGLPLGDSTRSITAVDVRLGANGQFVRATPTGSGTTPWASWSFSAVGVPQGPLAINVRVSAARSGFEGSIDVATRQVAIDLGPPALIVQPPADVTRSGPPYGATLTGSASDPAGVAAVEWRLGEGGAFQPAAGTTNWSAAVELPGLGSHRVGVRARDNLGNVSPVQTVEIKVIDVTAPGLSITAPGEGETFPQANGVATVEVRGTASDTQTGVAGVEWALDGQTAFTAAIPKAPDDWSIWTAAIPIRDAGNHAITLRARDKVAPTANTTTLQRAVVVAEPFEPQDPETVFSAAAYLDDLLNFATRRAKTAASGGTALSRALLTETFLQPFAELVHRNNRAVANRPVNQVRVCIEVLRRYLAKHGRSVPAAAEDAFRQAAYGAALRSLGTSHEEIRLARVADDSARAALASRLGFAPARFRPDRLDQLLLPPGELSDTALEALFGIEETTLKPLADSLLPEPLLLVWQKEQLRATWQEQDQSARSAVDTPQPVIDPDLLGEADLLSASAGNAAYDLWNARQRQVADRQAAVEAARRAQPTQLAGFDLIVSDTLGPAADLLALRDEHARGNAVEAPLRTRQLSLQAFLQLMRLRRLAEAGSMLEAEWQDVYAILVQVQKFRLYSAWREEERQHNLTLGPDHFRLTEAAQPVLPAWRASLRARQGWRRTLETRIGQDRALAQAAQAMADAAEEAALPLLRDACLVAMASEQNPAETGDRLSQELGIDCRSSGRQKTTRVHQALETLQEVLFSLRTGRFKALPAVLGNANPAADWVLALDPAKPYLEADFDEEWRWMGGYASWHAAIRVFAYPENYLLPELRPEAAQTAAYSKLMKNLRDQQRLTPTQARGFATAYHQALAAELGDALPALLRPGALLITEALSDTQLAERRSLVAGLFAGIGNPHQAPAHVKEVFYFVPMALALHLQKSDQFLAALDWIETVYTDHLAGGERKIYRGLALEEGIPTQFQRNPDNWLRAGLNPHEIVAVRSNAHTRFTLMALVRCYLAFADAEFTRDTSESVPRARTLYGTALALLALPEMRPAATGPAASPFPPNPVSEALRLHAELNLFKLRSGRNIAGIERQSAAASLPSLASPGLPFERPAERLLRPTPYRYAVLVERARSLVNIAQQVEAAFLAALEKRDAETYNQLKAGHDLQLAGATLDLHALRVDEAEGGIALAELQQDRAETQRDAYQGWIDAGLNRWESSMLENYRDAGKKRNTLAALDAAVTIAQAALGASSGGLFGSGVGAAWGGVGLVAGFAALRAGATVGVNNEETSAQINSATASFERRRQEWELQRQVAEHEVGIGAQQFALARTHRDIARREESIARTQRDQAQATVDFLANKFTNAELYEWMSGILGGAYSYFLQQATAIAQLAQHQLAFERQETTPAFIKADYWEASEEAAPAAGGETREPDRRGLTGSVRLLQDVTRLDQFAFETRKRKLQLAQTFSLARLFPAEFQRFRGTGSLPFATPMPLFDEGFPGHYLRLIKRVRVSVVALVPPTRGLRATLVNSGLSRVVSGGESFQTVVVRRDPEAIAFTSPSSATGLLELEPEGELLLPFESVGVDTSWEMQLPRAANPFDFHTISDVLFTVEYTALQSTTYRQQVIRQLDDKAGSERTLSLRDDFADEWYALHNPIPANAPLRVRFKTTRSDFPPNLEDLRIGQVMVAFVRAAEKVFEVDGARLTLAADGDNAPAGGAAGGSVEGILSTRRSNASGWSGLIGRIPVGEWELSLPDTAEMRSRFHNEEIEDILMVLTYEGRTPAWPA